MSIPRRNRRAIENHPRENAPRGLRQRIASSFRAGWLACAALGAGFGCSPSSTHGSGGAKSNVADASASSEVAAASTRPGQWVTTPAHSVVQVGGSTIELSTPQILPVSINSIEQWIDRASFALQSFYGRFPVPNVTITILPSRSGRIQGGVENGGKRITVMLGPQTRESDFADDWILTHEMFHLSQPDLDHAYSWMSEGMADYLEPVARARVGQISPEKFWRDFMQGMPQGLPDAGDGGLDGTADWGRTYWGGCMFWMLADIRIRQQTHNEKSVRDAAKAVLDAGGDGSQQWTLNELLAAYDRGTGTTVFSDLHHEIGTQPGQVDLTQIWKSLGVQSQRGRIVFSDAPLATVRGGMTAR